MQTGNYKKLMEAITTEPLITVEVLHMDWIYISPAKKNGKHEYEWNLILRDDLSGVVKITPARVPDTEVTLEALMEWRALFGSPKILVYDMASYFVSTTMKRFAE